MKRSALLIGNTGGLEGIGVDIERTRRFLMSPRGGQWKDSEITELFDPSKKQVDQVFRSISSGRVDYFFFLFTGHGCHYGQTELSLNDHETLHESELNSLADRQLSIFDCCRVERSIVSEALEARAITLDSVDITRRRYEDRIMQAAKQHVKLYACSIGEFSYDSPKGAIYLTNLLSAAESVSKDIITVEEAHSAARVQTIADATRNGNKQTPAAVQPKLPRDMQLILSIK